MRIPLNEVYEILKNTNSIIVHCAGYTKGHSETTCNCTPIERLLNVINNQLAISCSTIKENDRYNDYRKNYTGYLGLILFPNADQAISHASCEDAGTSWEERNKGQKEKNSVSKLELLDAINNRDTNKLNELCIYNYIVIGAFFEFLPLTFPVTDAVQIQNMIRNGESDLQYSYDAKEIFENFKDVKIFKLINGSFFESICINGSFFIGNKIGIEEMYKPFIK